MENDRNTIKSIFSLPWQPPILPRWAAHAAKRALDILAAALGLLLLSPVFGLLSFLVKRDSPGPVFFRGARMGKEGRVFQILKFRTMREVPESCLSGLYDRIFAGSKVEAYPGRGVPYGAVEGPVLPAPGPQAQVSAVEGEQTYGDSIY